MKKLMRFLRPYRKECVLAPFFKLSEAGFDLLVPVVIRHIVNEGIGKGDTSVILPDTLLLVLLGVLGFVAAVVAQYFAARAAVGFSSDLRGSLFAHIQKMPYAETDAVGTSTLITRMSSDVNRLQDGVNMVLRLFLRSPVIVFGAWIAALIINERAGRVFSAVIPLLFLVVTAILLGTVPLYRKTQEKLDRVTAVTRENIVGVHVIRAFNKQSSETARFDEVNREHTESLRFVGKISALLNPLTYVFLNVGVVALLWVCNLQFGNGSVSDGDILALYNYMGQILVELIKLANTVFLVTKSLACAKRVEAIFDLPVGMPVAEDTREIHDGTRVRFTDVSFRYRGAGEVSLDGISLSAFPGETVGIIGGTGSGKTSLVNLIPRFYDATDGLVRVDGKDVRSYPVSALRQIIGVVPQKAELFAGTVRSNLLWGNKNATDDDLWEALCTAQASEFVKEKGGLDAAVEPRGSNFSGGQRQRLTVARALVRKPEILILDDSSSALDYATDASLRRAVKELPYHPTVFVISQRTASILSSDKILVLDEGKPVGLGTHEELLRSCPVYAEIHASQFRDAGGDAP